MDQIDEFESMFRKAERESFSHVEMPIESVALVTDGDAAAAQALRDSLKEFLPMLADADNWRLITGEDYSNVAQLQGPKSGAGQIRRLFFNAMGEETKLLHAF